MPKAEIKVPNGTHIIVNGSVEDISKIISMYSQKSDSLDISKRKKKKGKKAKSVAPKKRESKSGLIFYVRELKQENFFKSEKNLKDILQALKEKGQLYPLASLGKTMITLVRKRELRRIKKDNKWHYVHRE